MAKPKAGLASGERLSLAWEASVQGTVTAASAGLGQHGRSSGAQKVARTGHQKAWIKKLLIENNGRWGFYRHFENCKERTE